MNDQLILAVIGKVTHFLMHMGTHPGWSQGFPCSPFTGAFPSASVADTEKLPLLAFYTESLSLCYYAGLVTKHQ